VSASAGVSSRATPVPKADIRSPPAVATTAVRLEVSERTPLVTAVMMLVGVKGRRAARCRATVVELKLDLS
jgi:hypothetical protein